MHYQVLQHVQTAVAQAAQLNADTHTAELLLHAQRHVEDLQNMSQLHGRDVFTWGDTTITLDQARMRLQEAIEGVQTRAEAARRKAEAAAKAAT